MVQRTGARGGTKVHLEPVGVLFRARDAGAEVEEPRQRQPIRKQATRGRRLGQRGERTRARRCELPWQRQRLEPAVELERARLDLPVEEVRHRAAR